MPRRKPGTLFPLELDILEAGLSIQSADDAFYGFSLARALSSGSESTGLVAHGTLYKALARMTEAGLLRSEWEDAEEAANAGRPRRRLYRVTGEGERAARNARSALATPVGSGKVAFA